MGGEPLLKPITGFQPTGTFTLQDAPSFPRRDSEELEGNPDIKGIFRLVYYYPDYKFRAATRVNYIGDQHVSNGEDKSGYVTVNLYFSKDFINQIQVFAGIDNLFNEKKAYDGLTYVEPVSAYAGFSIQF